MLLFDNIISFIDKGKNRLNIKDEMKKAVPAAGLHLLKTAFRNSVFSITGQIFETSVCLGSGPVKHSIQVQIEPRKVRMSKVITRAPGSHQGIVFVLEHKRF